MKVLAKWKEIVSCLIYTDESLLQIGPEFLHGHQTFVAGAGKEEKNKTWYNGMEHPAPEFKCNADEADTRVWLHVARASRSRKLLYSPNPDVYHIGLTNANLGTDEIIVQLSPIGQDLKLIHMKRVQQSHLNSPRSLSYTVCLTTPNSLCLIHTHWVWLHTFFFGGIGNTAFLKCYFHFSYFIIAQFPTLPDTSVHTLIMKAMAS